ncbi:MAG: C45 family peptidase, partial [Clostridia bacterium]|nr:C45 family peptidase [Clostridia bacterium]
LYTLSYPRAGQCSQIAVNSDVTENGHIFVARNYDMFPQDNPTLLCTTKVRGKYSHIGFSYMLFDRVDGLNEHGLCLTMTQAGPGILDDHYVDVFYRRTILDSCRNVNEALDFIRETPNFCSSNMIIADKTGNIALIEMGLNGKRAVKAISQGSFEKYIFTTNHYTLPSMVEYYPKSDPNSIARYNIIKERLKEFAPEIAKGDLMLLLSSRMPFGVFNATLWSIVFDLNELKAFIRFGAPVLNQVKKYSLNDPAGVREFQVKYSE